MSEKRTPQDQDKYVLRFPEGMRERLKAEAADFGRSMNNEIIYRLMQSLGDAPDGPEIRLNIPETLQQRIAKAASRHHATMNEEILNILYEHFPEPRTLEDAAYELSEIVKVLTPASGVAELDAVLRKMEGLAFDIGRGRVPTESDTREAIAEKYESYVENRIEEQGRPPIGEDE